jgi:hypothetical protein
MTTNQLDDAFESFLAGRPVPAEAADLVVFAETVREISARPGRPGPRLAEILATGLLPDPVGASTESVPISPGSARAAAPGLPRRRRTMIGILAAAAAKFASAGAVAQASTGVGLALVSVTGAGAAGALPGPVQDSVASVIESVSPFDLPDSADLPVLPEQAVVPEVPDHAPENLPRPEDIPTDEQFGTSVSGDAQDGGVDGEQTSTDSRETYQPEQPEAPAQAPAQEQAPAPKQAPAPVEAPSAGSGSAGSGGQDAADTGRR